MTISIIGSGRVGLSLGAVLAEAGFQVFMTDKNLLRKQAVKALRLPFFEPELQMVLQKNQARLEWTRYIQKILSADFIFFCLSYPLNKKGYPDLSSVFEWVRLITRETNKKKYLVLKSTFPVGTNKKIQKLVLEEKAPLFVITCPEFLSQGRALKDVTYPERLVIGAEDLKAGEKLEELYKKFSHPKQVIHTDPQTAELAKLACNAFLATKISFINEWAGLCEKTRGDMRKLQLILSSDPRIGKAFLTPGLGYGGYCLPKDLSLSLQEGKNRNQKMSLLKGVQQINSSRTKSFFEKILFYYKNLDKIPLAFWGISFKKNTDDLKNSPALKLLCRLLKAGAELHVYDPLFVEEKIFSLFDKNTSPECGYNKQRFFKNFFLPEEDIVFLRKKIFQGQVMFYKSALESLERKQGLIVANDCDEFRQIPLLEIKKKLTKPFLVDGRNVFLAEDLRKAKFCFHQAGSFFV